jgi:hypothetical protein
MFCTVMEAYKNLPYPGFEQKCSAASYCQLKLRLFFTFCHVNHQCQAMSKFCVEPLWYGGQTLPGIWIYATYLFENKFKALHTLLNRAEYTITRKRVFLFPCLKILLGHSNRWTLCHPHQPSCGVHSSWEGREILAISALPFSTLCDKPPDSLALLPSRASSHMRSNPALLSPQRRYEAIRV